jgi:hypothetical protein
MISRRYRNVPKGKKMFQKGQSRRLSDEVEVKVEAEVKAEEGE